MARVKYDVSGVEGARKVVPAGVYNAKIVQADVTKPEGKDQRIELVLEVVNDSEHDGAKLYEWVNLESEAARWKLRELLEAAGVVTGSKKESGTLDTDRMLLNKIIGVKTMVRPADEARGFDESARVRRMFALDGANGSEAEELDEPEAEAEADDGDVDLDTLDRAELKKYIKEEGLDIRVLKSMSDDDIRDAIEALYEGEGEEEEAEEEEPEEDEEGEEDESGAVDLEGMEIGELRKLAQSLKIKTRGKRRPALIEEIEAHPEFGEAEPEDEEEAEEEEAEADAEAPDDYDEWEESDLTEELTQRSLSTKGSKRAMIGRLRKDDAEEDKPF